MKLVYWLLFLGLVLVASLFLFLGLLRKLEAEQLFVLEQSMAETAQALEAQTASVLSGQPPLEILRATLRTTQNVTGSRVRVLNQNRDLVADSLSGKEGGPQDQLRFRPEIQSAFTGHYGAYTRLADETDRSLALFVALPVKGEERVNGVIYVSHTTDDILQHLGVMRRAGNKILLGLAGLLFLGALLVAGKLRGTLTRLTTLTSFVSAAETQEIPVKGHDQVAEISENFNRLIANLRSQIAQLEEEKSKTKLFLEDVAHELKTPITGLVGSVETLRDEKVNPEARERLLANLEKETSRLSELTARLLELQKLDYAQLSMEPFDVLSVAETVVDSYQRAAEKKDVKLSVECEETTPVMGDARRIQRVLENLVENAVRCSPADGSVEIALERSGQEVVVSVLDDGPGPPEPTAFQRHHQGKVGKGSMGLGLSIASEILHKHGSELKVVAGESGGSVFSFVLNSPPTQT